MDRTKLRAELIRDEGCKLKAYRDSAVSPDGKGYWTIGVGHLLGYGDEPRIKEITMHEAMAFLEADIDEAVKTLAGLVTIDLDCACSHLLCDEDRVRYRALVNMAFNLGPKLAEFKNTLKFIHVRAWDDSADNMLRSAWAGQVGDRAKRISDMVRKGKDVT